VWAAKRETSGNKSIGPAPNDLRTAPLIGAFDHVIHRRFSPGHGGLARMQQTVKGRLFMPYTESIH
jgi:hypothetical protein